MNVHVGKIEKERLFFIFADKPDRFLHIPFGQRALIRLLLYYFFIPEQGERRILKMLEPLLDSHIVTIGQSVIGIKTVPGGQELRLIAAVPLAHQFCGVSLLFQEGRDCYLFGIKPAALPREQNSPSVEQIKSDSPGIATGHHGSPGWRTDRGGHVEIGKDDPLLSDPV
jgi:hypothetical protein